jgi:hypothetical protein
MMQDRLTFAWIPIPNTDYVLHPGKDWLPKCHSVFCARSNHSINQPVAFMQPSIWWTRREYACKGCMLYKPQGAPMKEVSYWVSSTVV